MSQRQQSLDALDERELDVLVVGGGINGAVSAAALVAHGARVGLVERGDFAGQTSMHSSNLAWGGIKYMETLELGLVRKLCRARNELMRAYPSAVRETRFLLTVARGSRWGRLGHVLLYVGALLYWAIGGFFTRRPRLLSRAAIAREEPTVAIDGAVGGIEYSDARLVDNDASFVLGFIRDAVARGAVVANYAASEGSTWDGERWTTEVRDLSGDGVGDRMITVRSRVVVNACGPYVEEHDARSGIKTRHRHVLSKGVHLIVPRVTEHERVLAFFADDGRLFFVIPMGDRSSIGTTDTRVESPEAQATDEDRQFILSNINARLRLPRPLTMDDVIAERCGVRPLVVSAVDDGEQDQEWTALSRKHEIEVDRARKHVSIFGGKLTDCINVGHEVVEEVIGLGVELEPKPSKGRWYGEREPQRRGEVVARAEALGLREADAEGLWRRLQGRALSVLDRIEAETGPEPRLAQPVIEGGEVLWAEVAEAAEHERVVRLEDFLRRRTRLSQVVPKEALRAVLPEIAAVLFGERAEQELRVYEAGDGEAAGESAAEPSRRLG